MANAQRAEATALTLADAVLADAMGWSHLVPLLAGGWCRAAAAVDLFLTRDALAPAALPLPDRAAHRLCDRLVDLGAVREVTGRDSVHLCGK